MIALIITLLLFVLLVSPTVPEEEPRLKAASSQVRVLQRVPCNIKILPESAKRYFHNSHEQVLKDQETQKLKPADQYENVLKVNPQERISKLILQKYPINIVKPDLNICYTMPCRPSDGRGTILERKAIPDNKISTVSESKPKSNRILIKKADDKKVKPKILKPPVAPFP